MFFMLHISRCAKCAIYVQRCELNVNYVNCLRMEVTLQATFRKVAGTIINSRIEILLRMVPYY